MQRLTLFYKSGCLGTGNYDEFTVKQWFDHVTDIDNDDRVKLTFCVKGCHWFSVYTTCLVGFQVGPSPIQTTKEN